MTTSYVLAIVILFAVAVVSVIAMRRKLKLDSQQVIPHPLTLGRFLTALSVFAGLWVNGYLFRRFWPNASIAAEIGVAVGFTICVLLLYRKHIPRGSTNLRSWWRIAEGLAGTALFAVENHNRLHEAATDSHSSGWAWLIGAGIVIGLILLLIGPTMVLGWMLHKAQERGDHRGSMRVLDRFGPLLGRSMREDFRAMLLVYAGEPKQAESLIRSVIGNRKQTALKDDLNKNLGQALIDQKRYSEAGTIFEQVVKGSPQQMGGYDGLAEVRILEGRPREALELIEQAIRCEEARSWIVRKFEAYEQGHLWANRAWGRRRWDGVRKRRKRWSGRSRRRVRTSLNSQAYIIARGCSGVFSTGQGKLGSISGPHWSLIRMGGMAKSRAKRN
jgi:tetratricopeptide (TPR) repeat protein